MIPERRQRLSLCLSPFPHHLHHRAKVDSHRTLGIPRRGPLIGRIHGIWIIAFDSVLLARGVTANFGIRKYVQRNSKIRVESKERVCDAWEKLGESEGFCREGRKGAMRDDAMRMIAKNVFACWGENGGPMEASGEVGSEERPDWKRAKEIGAVGEGARLSSAGKEDIDQVGNEDRPEQRNGAEQEEGTEKKGNAESVSEDNEGL